MVGMVRMGAPIPWVNVLELTLGSGYVGQRFSGLCPKGSVGSQGFASAAIVAAFNKATATRITVLPIPQVVEDSVMERINFRRDQQKGFRPHLLGVDAQALLGMPQKCSQIHRHQYCY